MQFKMLSAVMVLFFATHSVVQAEGVSKEFKLEKGRTSGTVSGCVNGANMDEYLLGAKQGQMMVVSIESEENNAVFDLYYLTDDGDNGWKIVNGAGGDERKKWEGRLPSDGGVGKSECYKIEVGKERGNACYKLKVSIK